jgi:predicted deacylase
MRTPLLAIWPPGLQLERAARQRRYLELLDAHVVWVFGNAPEDISTYSSSLDAAMEKQGVDVLAVEMSDLPELDEPLLSRGLSGLLRIAAACGCIEDQERPLRKTTVYVQRSLLRAPGAGIFEPVAPLAGILKEGDIIGELIPMERPGTRVSISSPASGYLVQRLSRRFVRPGDMIATVGTPAELL